MQKVCCRPSQATRSSRAVIPLDALNVVYGTFEICVRIFSPAELVLEFAGPKTEIILQDPFSPTIGAGRSM